MDGPRVMNQAIVDQARALVAQFSGAARPLLALGLYGARDAQLAAVVVELAEQAARPAELAEIKAELAETRRINGEDEAKLREIIDQLATIIEENLTGFEDICKEARSDADL